MEETEKFIAAYELLHRSVPAIGILNRKKRIMAYIKISKMVQEMVDEQEISGGQGLTLLSLLAGKCADFQKATMMVALNLANINKKMLRPLGFKYANDFRCNLQMLPIDDDDNKEKIGSKEK